MPVASFHFHGYQPGDLVRWTEPDPLKPPRFEARRSPVSLRIGGESVRGANWTDAVLRAYGRVEAVLESVAGAASVDVEPQTLAWLLETDPDAYVHLLAAWEAGAAGLAITPPFHPILPHLHALEREALLEMMVDFFAPILRRQHGRAVGLWLPECAYSAEAMRDYVAVARRAPGRHQGLPDLLTHVHVLLDRRQLAGTPDPGAWHRVGVDRGIPAAARDPALSGDFAFGGSTAQDFATAAKARGVDSLLVASDLESLLANPAQAERFRAIVERLRSEGFAVSAPVPAAATRVAPVVDYSSWSDYDEHLHEGRTSDTRWTGLRRSDGRVVSRDHRGAKVSQLWKHGLALAMEQVETAVRRAVRDAFPAPDAERRREAMRRLAVAYGRHLWRDHYLANGFATGDVDFAKAAERIAGGVDVEAAAYLARAYVTMLMGLRSDPQFWDAPDTRVTFQGVACLASSLADAAEAWRRLGQPDRARQLLRVLQAALLEFAEAHGRAGLAALHGVEGWETAEEAWLRALQSEVPDRSGYDVIRRAALFAAPDAVEGSGLRVHAEEVVADAGRIVGEAHGEWEQTGWCEHRAN